MLWLKNHCDEFGARNDQIMVAGESAGGGLTAAVTILARDKKEVNIAFQMPIYPMIDDRMITESSKNNHAPAWNTYNNREAWRLYLGDLFETENVPHYAAPARLTDFSGLPPALTFVGDLEPFLDETIQYFENLKSAGISAECRVYKGCFHGFDIIKLSAQISKKALNEFMESFRHAVQTYFKEQPKK